MENISDENLKLFDEESFEERYNLFAIFGISNFGEGDYSTFRQYKKYNSGVAMVFKPTKRVELGTTVYYNSSQKVQEHETVQTYIGTNFRTEAAINKNTKNSALKTNFFVNVNLTDSTQIFFSTFFKKRFDENTLLNDWTLLEIDTSQIFYNFDSDNSYIIPNIQLKHRWKNFGVDFSSKADWWQRGEQSHKLSIVSDSLKYPFSDSKFEQLQLADLLAINSSISLSMVDSTNTLSVGLEHHDSNSTLNLINSDETILNDTFLTKGNYALKYVSYSPFLKVNYKYGKKIYFNVTLKQHFYDWKSLKLNPNQFTQFESGIEYEYGMFRILSLKYQRLPTLPSVFDVTDSYRMEDWNQFLIGNQNFIITPSAIFSAALVHTIPKYGITLMGLYINGTSQIGNSYDFTSSPLYSLSRVQQLSSDFEIFQVEPSLPIGADFSLDLGYYRQKSKNENEITGIGMYNVNLTTNELTLKLSSLFSKNIFNFNSKVSYINETYNVDKQENISSSILKFSLNLRNAFFNKRFGYRSELVKKILVSKV
ncbi:MAG: hypothetical protein HC908_10870 [Calothrix sp. SM1_7_51]|nr:hypothetical protein [Calothrix sp. SM1_7_51]